MRELVVMQATGQFGFLEVRGNVFVWHLLHASLQQIVLLRIFSLSDNEPKGIVALYLPLPLTTTYYHLRKTFSGPWS